MMTSSYSISGHISDVEMQQNRHPLPPTISFGRRTSSGRYTNFSRDDLDIEMSSTEFANYTVHIPPTPDNQPMDLAISTKVEEQYVSNSIFTGGFNSATRAHFMDKIIESEANHSQMARGRGSYCAVRGCDEKIMRDEHGKEILPCECDFKICRECYIDAVKTGGGICPGCKDPYKETDLNELSVDTRRPLSLPPADGMSNMERRLSLIRSHTGDFDYNRFLFQTSGTYGYGSVIWPENGRFRNGNGRAHLETTYNPGRPLTRKLKIPAAVLSPYRLIIFVRMIVLGLFLAWRIKHPNRDAIWLWGMSVVCELWFAFSWLLDQLPKLFPTNRATDLAILKEKFEEPYKDSGPDSSKEEVDRTANFAIPKENSEEPYKVSVLDNSTEKSKCQESGPSNSKEENYPKKVDSSKREKNDLPGIDVFVSTADPEKEPPLVTANTILSILAANYPVQKLSCYVSDDGGALLTFEAMAEAASFAEIWVPFCRKHDIEPRNPECYFNSTRDPYKNKVKLDFVRDRRLVKREYDEFKVRINALPDAIRRRSEAQNTREEINAMKSQRPNADHELIESVKIPKATWMADRTQWPGTWSVPTTDHSRGDHAGIVQVMLKPPSDEPLKGISCGDDDSKLIDFADVDVRLPMLVYVSREKRPGYDHNKKAGAMNALVRASSIMSNGPFILNLDCDHYIYNSHALREGMCFMMDRGGERICYVQFPQRFDGIDPSDCYANNNTVFFDVNMRALDGLQGPVYVGTGCLFRRIAIFGFDPPHSKDHCSWLSCCFARRKKPATVASEENPALGMGDDDDNDMNQALLPKKFGNSTLLLDSILEAEYEGRPIADLSKKDRQLIADVLEKECPRDEKKKEECLSFADLIKKGGPLSTFPALKYTRMPGHLTTPRKLLDAPTVAEAVSVISCWYEDKTEWGRSVGWIYGSVTEDVVTGYRMHNRGWRSVYCVTERDAFRGTAPINLTDRLHQVLRWATGSVEIFFSRNNAIFASPRMKFLQRVAYLNVGIYPFTSIFLIVYCFLPALSLFSGQFIVQTLNVTFLVYLLTITLTLCALAMLEIKWSGIRLEEWWRNEQFWLIGGTSAHLAAVIQGLLKVIAGIEISFTLTSKSAGDDADDEFADLYIFKWTSLMIPPITIMLTNMIAIAVGVSRTLYSTVPQWSRLLGGVFFSFWVLTHLYPFAKGLMGRRGKTPTIVFIWSGLLAVTISLLWVAISPPSPTTDIGGSFQFP